MKNLKFLDLLENIGIKTVLTGVWGDMEQQLGSGVRHLFLLEEGTAFTNHGSYGTVPNKVMEERFRLLSLMDSHPDKWYRNTLRPLYNKAVENLAKFVGSDPNNLVFVPNATAAVNTVVKNLNLGPEDIILSNSHTYNACSNASAWSDSKSFYLDESG